MNNQKLLAPNLAFKHPIMAIIAAVLLAALPLVTMPQPQAQTWPSRVVKIVVSGNPGNASDITARLLAQHLSVVWGQGVVVDNQPAGPGGILAAQFTARAAPDGHTLMMATTPQLAMNQFLFKSPGYDAERDFVPIVLVSRGPMMISVNPGLPVENLTELAAFSKARPGKVFFSVPGTRNLPHFLGEAFNQLASAGMTPVPYRSGQAGSGTASGDTQVYIDAIQPMAPWIDGGRLRPIAVFGPKRLPAYPAVPTAKESGFDVAMLAWMALVAPAGTPPEVVARINRDVNAVLARPEVAATFRGMFELGSSVREFEDYLAQERKFWGKYLPTHGFEKE